MIIESTKKALRLPLGNAKRGLAMARCAEFFPFTSSSRTCVDVGRDVFGGV